MKTAKKPTITGFFPFLIPYNLLPGILRFIRELINFNEYTSNWFSQNIFFLLGTVSYVSYSLVLLVKLFKEKKVNLAVAFWLAAIFCILFFTLAGYGEKVTSKNFDYSILNYESQFTGAAYVLQPLIFLIISLYLFAVDLFNKVKSKYAYDFACLTLIVLIISGYMFSIKIHKETNEGPVAYRVLVENILKMAPDNDRRKVIYSTEGEIHAVKFLGVSGVHWFYKNMAPIYIENKLDLEKYMKINETLGEDFFAFAYDEPNLRFEDKSLEVRKEMADYLTDF